jgi:hypothetical protein
VIDWAERFARAARIQPGVDGDAALVEPTAVETQAQFRTSVPFAHAPRAPHRWIASSSGNKTTLSCSLGSVREITATQGSVELAL